MRTKLLFTQITSVGVIENNLQNSQGVPIFFATFFFIFVSKQIISTLYIYSMAIFEWWNKTTELWYFNIFIILYRYYCLNIIFDY